MAGPVVAHGGPGVGSVGVYVDDSRLSRTRFGVVDGLVELFEEALESLGGGLVSLGLAFPSTCLGVGAEGEFELSASAESGGIRRTKTCNGPGRWGHTLCC